MAGDPGARRLLPQSTQMMQSFSFAPPSFGPRENQKNYVFVDEHNRHKRLKVMRACEGCRRRKIKCDAATTNTWPCSACIRLKLHCVPPTVNYEREFAQGGQGFEQTEAGSGDEQYQQQLAMQQHLATNQRNVSPIYTQQVAYSDGVNVFQPGSYGDAAVAHTQTPVHYSNLHTPVNVMDQTQHYNQQQLYPGPPLSQQQQQQQQQTQVASASAYDQDPYNQQNLADLLGELKMDESGTAPYLISRRKNKGLIEEPAFEEVDDYKNLLPPTISGADMKIRIPPELMPEDETILHYFDIYFTDVHPYVPVLNKSHFYQQWHTNRESISPLILEAIFAIAGRLADEPAQGHQWLALASKHIDSFMDTPRLSTLQALLIVLKARESAPKRGYFYRSWMTVVQCVQMGKDLGLDEHFDDHKSGKPCGSDLAECITKTRIWQTIFVCELMIGSPQGRTDLAVDMDSLDLSIPRPSSNLEESEYHTTRHFAYFTRAIRLVRRMNAVYARIRKKEKWGLDPELVALNPSFDAWQSDLPGDLQITFPGDGNPPWIPSHFVANLHSYYYLSIIMLHRPQLMFMEQSGVDGTWKHHMMLCYSSAKSLCRLQEAILQTFGMTGLLCMQRGINYTIYCVLTCTVLHLVALTSPDPELNTDAREYFTRHMRILERCTSAWPMPDMQQQIDALREAFSADISKPFVLKPSFPYGSPAAPVNQTPPRLTTQYRQGGLQGSQNVHRQNMDQHHVQQSQQVSRYNHPISPPISAGGLTDTKSDSPAVQSLVMMATSQRGAPTQSMNVALNNDQTSWNPTRIFDQWNNTFGTPQSTKSPVEPTPLKIASGTHELPTLPEIHQSISTVSLPPASQSMTQQHYSGAPMPSFVSPSMWQESVASVYEGGLKRQHGWDYEDNISNKRAR